ncbi:MAG: FAD-dependent monooxygenase [Casimicrobiaceae bacterium]|nr:FAD-dependent monooxygenase [Casimicrobiaceae bacterium]
MNLLPELIIVGAGPVGLAAALALCREGAVRCVTVLEADPPEARSGDQRNLALSWASWQFLRCLGLELEALPRAPIERVEITQRGVFGCCRLAGEELGLPMLGAAVPYGALVQALRAQARAVEAEGAGLSVRYGTRAVAVEHDGRGAVVVLESGERLRASGVVLAEGTSGAERTLVPGLYTYERASAQSAVLARVHVEREHHAALAVERFAAGGPIVLVPRVVPPGARPEWTLIWVRPHAEAEPLMAAAEAAFFAQANAQAASSLGRLSPVSDPTARRTCYPLAWRVTEPRACGAVVALGNAAQALHPVAAQGLNLGLADARELALTLTASGAAGLDLPLAFARYARSRAPDRLLRLGLTGLLAYGFDRGGWLFDVPRGLALQALDLLPPLKKALVRGLVAG